MTRFCPNPACPSRGRTGRAAEYHIGVERCADCGANLVAENPTPARRPASWPAPLRRRLWMTALGAALVFLAALVPSPFLDLEAATEGLRTTWPWLSLQFGPFALGLGPVLGAFLLVELAALAVPRWNRRRHGDPGFRRTLLFRSLVVGLLLALLQGYFIAVWLEAAGHSYGVYGPEQILNGEPGLAFRLHFALTAAAGTLLLAMAALAISRHGVGNGFAVLLVVELLRGLPVGLYDRGAELVREVNPGVLLFGGLILLFLLGSIALSFLRPPRLTRGGLPLLLPTSGILPIELGTPLLLLPSTLLALFDLPWLRTVSEATVPGSTSYLLIQLGMILVFVPLGSWLYWWRFRARLRGPGLRAAWLGAQVWSVALLGALVLIFHGFLREVPSELTSRLSLLWLIPVVVITMDLVTEIRARRRAPGAADLVPLAEYQHPAEAVEDALGRAPEVGAVVQGLRFRTLHYFFAPQVPCRVLGVPPAAPSWVQDEPPTGEGKVSAPDARSRWANPRLRRGWAKGRFHAHASA